jgi:hypothetical protein
VNSLHFVGHTFPQSTLRALSTTLFFVFFKWKTFSLFSREYIFYRFNSLDSTSFFAVFCFSSPKDFDAKKTKQNTKWEKPEKEKRFCGAGIIGVCCQSAARSTSVGVYIIISAFDPKMDRTDTDCTLSRWAAGGHGAQQSPAQYSRERKRE